MSQSTAAAPTRERAFAALHHADFRAYFITSMLSMMGDSIEHVITYWVLFQTFQSPILAGFATISHWLPFLLCSVYFGGLADRRDCRRLIQLSQFIFLGVSLSWTVLFFSGWLELWHAVVLLLLHGLAGAIWSPPSQLILHDMVGPEHLQSAVRLTATSRYLGLLLGPAVGGALMLAVGAPLGMLINSAAYLPLILWLCVVPYTGRAVHAVARRGPLGLGLNDARKILSGVGGQRAIVAMIALAAVTSFMVGSGLQPVMPEFARGVGAGGDEVAYAVLLGANAAGSVIGGLLLESRGLLPSSARMAIILAGLWCVALGAFAAATDYVLALVLLFLAGAFNLAFSAMAQTVVQLEAAPEQRGRIVGLFNMASLGLRTGSGFTIGVLGAWVGVHWSLGLSAAVMLLLTLRIWTFLRPGRRPPSPTE